MRFVLYDDLYLYSSQGLISNEAIKGWQLLHLGMCVANFRQTQRSITVVVPAGK